MVDIILFPIHRLIPASPVESPTVIVAQMELSAHNAHLIFISSMMAQHPIVNSVSVPAVLVEPIVMLAMIVISLLLNLAIRNIPFVEHAKVHVPPVIMRPPVHLALLVHISMPQIYVPHVLPLVIA